MPFAMSDTSIATARTASSAGQGATILDGAGEGACHAGHATTGNIASAWIVAPAVTWSYGNDLNGPSRDRLEALLTYVTAVEAAAQSDRPA